MRKSPTPRTALVKQHCGHITSVPLPRLKSLRQLEIEYRERTLCPACWAKQIAEVPATWTGLKR
jgi:hypothetical protein